MRRRFMFMPLDIALLTLGTSLLLGVPSAQAQKPHASASAQSKASKIAPKSSGLPSRKSRKKNLVSQKTLDTHYTDRPAIQAWIDDVIKRLPLPVSWLRQQIGQAHRLPQVEQLVLPAPSPVAKNWTAYRERFVEPRRIDAGVAFWQKHQAALTRAEQQYGVPSQIIVGILGVETMYGRHTGNFRILDVLTTLAFDFPSAHPRASERQTFFRNELEQFLLLAHKNHVDPPSLRGSYAGAMGLPQFMPSSWVRFAVDFDDDGQIDLFNNPTDAIGSVANYFHAFQWRSGLPTHYPVTLTPGQTDMDTLLAPDILPSFSTDSFTAKGAQLEGAARQHPGPLALIELRNGEQAPSYVAGTENFYAITRYNWSSYYAMAVIELGEAVAQRMSK